LGVKSSCGRSRGNVFVTAPHRLREQISITQPRHRALQRRPMVMTLRVISLLFLTFHISSTRMSPPD
jgi:hypothetical protein